MNSAETIREVAPARTADWPWPIPSNLSEPTLGWCEPWDHSRGKRSLLASLNFLNLFAARAVRRSKITFRCGNGGRFRHIGAPDKDACQP